MVATLRLLRRALPGVRRFSAQTTALARPAPPPSAFLEPFTAPQPAAPPVLWLVEEELQEEAWEELNADFWHGYRDIPAMAAATEKGEILKLLESFVLVRRKHVNLFQRFKVAAIRNMEDWQAKDLALLCRHLAQLAFLHEDLLLAMAPRVLATAQHCSPQEMAWLADAYATARCEVPQATGELARQALRRLDDFEAPELCLLCSAFARLGLRQPLLLRSAAERLAAEEELCGRDLTLAAYAFGVAKHAEGLRAVAARVPGAVRSCTAADVSAILVALAKGGLRDDAALDALSAQAARKVAQFSAEKLALALRALAFFRRGSDAVFTKAVMALPRALLHARPAEVAVLLSALAEAGVVSEAAMDVAAPYFMEKAAFMRKEDWLMARRAYAVAGCEEAFLKAARLHLEAFE